MVGDYWAISGRKSLFFRPRDYPEGVHFGVDLRRDALDAEAAVGLGDQLGVLQRHLSGAINFQKIGFGRIWLIWEEFRLISEEFRRLISEELRLISEDFRRMYRNSKECEATPPVFKVI